MSLKSLFTLDGRFVYDLTKGSESRVELKCNDCGKESTTTFANYNRMVTARGLDVTFCRKCSCTRSGKDKIGKPIKKTKRPNYTKSNHASWKGGRSITSDGYVNVYVGVKQYRKEHLLVMEKHIGRVLEIQERVHHIDLDKINNELNNLVLHCNESSHRQSHNSLQEVNSTLIKAGLIGYNRNSNQYMAMGKLREFLEQLEEANQKPSIAGDSFEGSTTRGESQEDDNSSTSAGK